MTTERLQPDLAAALVAALGEMDELARDKTAKVDMKGGGSYSYNYTDLGSVLGYVRPILAKHGLAMMTPLTCDGQVVTVTPVVVHTSGERVEFPGFSLPAGRTPQETGSAATYARRYSVLAALNLATEDDDGATATRGAAARAERAERPWWQDKGWSSEAEHESFREHVRHEATAHGAEEFARWWREHGLKWPMSKSDVPLVEEKLRQLAAERPFEEVPG